MKKPVGSALVALLAMAFFTSACTKVGTPAVVVYLFQGQNEGIPDELGHDPALRDNLVKLFGYTHYQKLGEARASVTSTAEIDLKPSELFSIRITPDSREANRLNLELLLNDKPILRGRYFPKPDVPLIIRGPHYEKGNLILILNTYK